jgi:hypothetical protein
MAFYLDVVCCGGGEKDQLLFGHEIGIIFEKKGEYNSNLLWEASKKYHVFHEMNVIKFKWFSLRFTGSRCMCWQLEKKNMLNVYITTKYIYLYIQLRERES